MWLPFRNSSPPVGSAAYLWWLQLYITFTAATSLSSFNPKVDDLPQNCNTIYNRDIANCTDSDFTNGAPCSTPCSDSLLILAPQVQSACDNIDVTDPPNNIIRAFQKGQGIQALCPNIAVQTVTSMSRAPTSPNPDAAPPTQTSSTPSTFLIDTSSPPKSTMTETTSMMMMTTSTTMLTMFTSTTQPQAFSSMMTVTQTTKPAPTPIDDGSGGGSPFSPQGAASGMQVPQFALALPFAVAIFAARDMIR